MARGSWTYHLYYFLDSFVSIPVLTKNDREQEGRKEGSQREEEEQNVLYPLVFVCLFIIFQGSFLSRS